MIYANTYLKFPPTFTRTFVPATNDSFCGFMIQWYGRLFVISQHLMSLFNCNITHDKGHQCSEINCNTLSNVLILSDCTFHSGVDVIECSRL